MGKGKEQYGKRRENWRENEKDGKEYRDEEMVNEGEGGKERDRVAVFKCQTISEKQKVKKK